jgi:dihydrofolate reductase
MSKLRVCNFSISIDGFGAGPKQSLDNPIGVGGLAMHEWFFETRTFKQISGQDGGATGVDDNFAKRMIHNVGAWIMGRNMFGPIRGEWPDFNWKGWWGNNPPFHVPVFILTHYPRPSIEMEGGTTFHFVTDGIASALRKATAAAKGKDVGLGGGVSVIREYLKAGLIDELQLVITPVLLGSGEHLLAGLDLAKLGHRCVEFVPSTKVTHVVLKKEIKTVGDMGGR